MEYALHVWRVKFDTAFIGGASMESYRIDEKNRTALVLTRGNSLEDVSCEIIKSIGAQSVLQVVHEAHFIGRALNTPPA